MNIKEYNCCAEPGFEKAHLSVQNRSNMNYM